MQTTLRTSTQMNVKTSPISAFKRPLALAITLFLSGCITTIPHVPETYSDSTLPVQSEWSARQAADTADRKASEGLTESLLALFADPTLSELVNKSQTHNLALLQQKSATAAIAATVTQADAALAPSLDANLDTKRAESDSQVTQTNSLTLDASWELDLWGRWGAERDAVVADYQASQATYQSLKDSIAAQTMQAYVDAVSQTQLVALSEDKYESFEKTLSVVASQYQVGTADLDALTEARQNLASAEASRVESKLQLRNAIRSLQALVGEYPNGLDLVGIELPVLLASPKADIPANVLSRRPDVKSAWYEVQSANASITATEAARLPDISLTASLGNSSDALRDLLTGNTLWSLAASIGYSLFDNGSQDAQVAASQNLAEQSYYQYLETVQTALNEVETALDTEHTYYDYETAQREVVSQAHLLLDNAEQDYRDGLIDITDWLTYQRSYFTEQSTLINTINQRLQNRVSLGLALGLGV